MFTVEAEEDGPFVTVTAHGRLAAADYDPLSRELERLRARHGQLDMLLDLTPWQGWTPLGLWRDMRFNLAHRHGFRKIAVIGDHPWKRWLTLLGKPLFAAPMRFFEACQRAEAAAWLRQPPCNR